MRPHVRPRSPVPPPSAASAAPAPCDRMTDRPPAPHPPAPSPSVQANGHSCPCSPASPPPPPQHHRPLSLPPPPPHSAHPHPHPHLSPGGGRLKFFKDGKFILELERARDGDRWVSVPRKTFWPPPPSNATHSPASSSLPSNLHQERAASLSVSDDNSSLQSSPWQRDHCWKQLTPRRGLSKELNMLYIRPSTLPASVLQSKAARLKRRRPFDQGTVSATNGSSPGHSNGASSSPETPSEDMVDSATDCEPKSKHISVGKFKFFKNNKCDNNTTNNDTVKVYKKTNKKYKRRELCKIVEMLTERLPLNFIPVNAKITALNCKQEHMMISPRKRILRDLERVSLEDLANKRSKPKTGTGQTATVPQAGPSHASESAPPKSYNGVSSNSRRDTPPSKPVSSYSINSLLSISDDSPKEDKKSSSSAYKTESPASVHSPDPSPSPEHLRRSANWSRSSPVYMSSVSYNSRPKYLYSEEVPPVPYHMYPQYHLPHTSYMGAYPGYHHPRTPPLWLQFPPIPPGPWAPLAHPLVTDHAPRDDTPSDLPLNLSKH